MSYNNEIITGIKHKPQRKGLQENVDKTSPWLP